jgi:hypothetical protein
MPLGLQAFDDRPPWGVVTRRRRIGEQQRRQTPRSGKTPRMWRERPRVFARDVTRWNTVAVGRVRKMRGYIAGNDRWPNRRARVTLPRRLIRTGAVGVS